MTLPHDDDTNGWSEYRKHVLEQLTDNKRDHEALFEKLDGMGAKILLGAEDAHRQREEMTKSIRDTFVTKDRYIPVERAVYAMIGLICGGVIVGLITLLVRR